MTSRRFIMKKIGSHVLSTLFGLFLLFILFVSSFEIVCYNTKGLYEHEFKKYAVLDELSYWANADMTMPDLLSVMDETMLYLRGDRADLVVETTVNGKAREFYNAKEKSHMADVQDIFVLCLFFRNICCIGSLAILGLLTVLASPIHALHELAAGYIRTCLVFLVLLGTIGLLAASDFTKYFTIFHEIFFSQGNWLFDPRESLMINMLPEGFFSDMAFRIAVTFSALMAGVLLLSLILFIITRRKKA